VPTDPGDDEREVRDRLRGAHSYHVGQSATCSKPHGGRAVLLGDAPAPVPAIGQGFNAAVESAVVLDGFLAEPGVDPPNLEWTRATLPHGTRGMEAGVPGSHLDQPRPGICPGVGRRATSPSRRFLTTPALTLVRVSRLYGLFFCAGQPGGVHHDGQRS
jgi:hypothetical protein